MPRLQTLRFTLLLCAAIAASATAAVRTQAPRASPHDTASGSIDGADLTITYGRPYMRGRTIMGALVPYGRVWCPGADEATTLSTSAPLKLGDLAVGTGRYTLWMLPSEGDWQLVVNSQTGQWHTQHDAKRDIGPVTLEKRTLDKPVEQLTFSIEKTQAGGAIVMRWETTEVRAPFTVVH